jgi:hypothetical protein
MAKSRTTAATTVEEPIVEQNIETTAVVEEPQTVSEEPQTVVEEPQTVVEEPQTVVEEPTENTPVEGDTTGEGTTEGGNGEGTSEEGTPQTTTEGDNNETTTEPTLEDKFVEMSGINKPYAENIMKLPNFDYYIPVGSGIDLDKRSKLIADIKAANNENVESEQ